MEQEISVVTKQKAADRLSFHIQRIQGACNKTIDGIFELSGYLNDAVEELGKNVLKEWVKNKELPFNLRNAQKIMAISKYKKFSNPEVKKILPPSWGTLYLLTTLSDEEFEEAIDQNIINPGADRKDFESLKKKKKAVKKEAEVQSKIEEVVIEKELENTFQYSKDELKVLKNFSEIHNETIIYPDRFAIMAGKEHSIFGFYQLIEPKYHDAFGIADLKLFLKLQKDIPNHRLEVEGDSVSIHDILNKGRLKFNTEEPRMIREVKMIPEFFSGLRNILQISVEAEIISRFIRAKKDFKFLIFKNIDGQLFSFATNNLNRGIHLEIPIEHTTNDIGAGSVVVDVNRMKIIDGGYQVSFSVNDKNEGLVNFQHDEMNLEYFIPCFLSE